MEILFIVLLIVWILFIFSLLRGLKYLDNLDNVKRKIKGPQLLVDMPKISIVIAVKDEEKLIGKTLVNLKKIAYPNLEVIIVNDRSTDMTKELIENFVQSNLRFKVVNVTILPQGWLGKVNALNEGTKIASGEFLLFMDPGAEFDDELLIATVKICNEKNLDHLSIMPQIYSNSILLEVLMATSYLFYVSTGKPWMPIEKRPPSAAKGAGVFNFIRRDFLFKNTKGLEWLKMEVVEDVGLAQMIASAGGRSHFMSSGSFKFEFKWYQTLNEMIIGLEKNTMGALAGYNFCKAAAISLLSFACPVYPLVAFLLYHRSLLFSCGIIYFIVNIVFAYMARKLSKRSVITLFMLPVGMAIMGYILLRSSIICLRNGGIYWSGTLYPIRALREGKRVKFGL